MKKGGEFAQGLQRGREAALALYAKVKADDRFVPGFVPELDIVVFAPRAASLEETSARSRKIFVAAAGHGLHLAVAELPVKFFEGLAGQTPGDRDTLTSLRSVLMKPEHLDWVNPIWNRLQAATQESGSTVPRPR